jgi:hypothetical protein
MLGSVAVFGPLVVALWVFSVADVLATPRRDVRRLSKRRWLALTTLLPLAGSVAWVVAGRPSKRSRRTSTWPGQTVTITDSDIRALMTATGPFDTEDFRRRCRERAQEQRRRYAEQAARETNRARGTNGAE